MSERNIDVISAGHLCLDLIPAFTLKESVGNVGEVLIPGKMINMGKCIIAGGGPVTNAGVSIKRLGVKTEFIGKMGDDDFGRLIHEWYERNEGHFEGIKMVPGESTSYTIAICIPGVDRFYLHHCGANDSFCVDDVDFDIVKRSRLFLFGYPPWMAKIYADDGAELTKILKRVKELGTTTAMDLSIPDTDSEVAHANWRKILENWIPLCDMMVPSAEEVLLFLDKDRFFDLKKQAGAGSTILDLLSASDIKALADEMIEMGTGVAMVKCGHRGLFVKTAGAERLSQFGAAMPGDLEKWADRELWSPVYEEESFVGALGSGDSAIAGFLAAFVREHAVESCLCYANAAGSMNVTVPDGLSWNKGFEDLTERIEGGWGLKSMTIEDEGWRFDRGFWVGPSDNGNWGI